MLYLDDLDIALADHACTDADCLECEGVLPLLTDGDHVGVVVAEAGRGADDAFVLTLRCPTCDNAWRIAVRWGLLTGEPCAHEERWAVYQSGALRLVCVHCKVRTDWWA